MASGVTQQFRPDLSIDERAELLCTHDPDTVVVTVGVWPGEQPRGLADRIDTCVETEIDDSITVQVQYLEIGSSASD